MKTKWYSDEKARLDKKLTIINQSIFLMKKHGYTLQDKDLYQLINMRDTILVELEELQNKTREIIEKF